MTITINLVHLTAISLFTCKLCCIIGKLVVSSVAETLEGEAKLPVYGSF